MKYYKLIAPEAIKTPSDAISNPPYASLWTEKEMRPEWPSDAFIERYIPRGGVHYVNGFRYEKLTPFVVPARKPFRYAIVQLTYQGAVVFTGGGNGQDYDQALRVRRWAELNKVRYDSAIIHSKRVSESGAGSLHTITQTIKNGLVIKERIES